MLVDDHDVGGHALEAPVFLGLQDLAHQRHGVVPDHANEENGQIS